MSTEAPPDFHSRDGLIEALGERAFDRPPAIVCNAHITGLAVARGLATQGVPVIAIDRTGEGVAPYSNAVSVAGRVRYPLDDREGFRADVEAIADSLDSRPVVFPCMDEWALGLARTEPAGVSLPFAGFDVVDSVLDKASLYERAERLDVPTPETYRLTETAIDDAAEALGFPLIVKPVLKRRFEEQFGTNLVRAETREQLDETVAAAEDADIEVLAQEAIPKSKGDLCTVGSYLPSSADDEDDTSDKSREPVTFVGKRRAIYPPEFGTTCLVERADDVVRESLVPRALDVLGDAGYSGISEAEFLYDDRREEYVLLDVNTRPWKWIGLPIAAGANLPAAAYAEATGGEYEPEPIRDARWVYLRDYAALLAGHEVEDDLHREDWLSILSGEVDTRTDLVTAVYSPADPGPASQLLRTEFGDREYYCAC